MKKSKIETADTRKRIVTIASQLFLERGLAETGISDVMVAAGLTQGGFYRHFDSKDQLIAEANRAANERLFEYYGTATAGKSPREAIEIIVNLYLRQYQGDASPSLCPLANLGSELRHSSEHIRAVAMEGYASLVGAFTMLAEQVGVADHDSVGDAIVSTLVGAVTLSRLSVDPVTAENILEHAQSTVRSLVQSSAEVKELAERTT